MGVLKCTHTISVTALLTTAWSFPTGGSGLQSGQRGILVERGHAGDMPKLHIPPSGSLEVELVDTAITIDSVKPNSVVHPDGTAVVIHSGKDDYRTDPAGNAGNRIACRVISEDRTTVGRTLAQ
jgi:Cu-Zn family superoxide dismutase